MQIYWPVRVVILCKYLTNKSCNSVKIFGHWKQTATATINGRRRHEGDADDDHKWAAPPCIS
jgi:hypothetical protein